MNKNIINQLDLSKYNTDKIQQGYLEQYNSIFAEFLDKKINLLELGVYKGGSVRLWRDYFPLGNIVGIDINLTDIEIDQDRIHLFKGNQADTKFLTQTANSIAPEGFDIIIDDASHIGELTKIAFWHLFDNHLKPNGLYIIEDWGTRYWHDWTDGKTFDIESYQCKRRYKTNSIWAKVVRRIFAKSRWPSHSYGMVGFIKQLVDEQGASDATRGCLKGTVKRKSKFESMVIRGSIVIIKKNYALVCDE